MKCALLFFLKGESRIVVSLVFFNEAAYAQEVVMQFMIFFPKYTFKEVKISPLQYLEKVEVLLSDSGSL